MVEDDIFDDIETAGLDPDDMPEVDRALGSHHDDDFKTGHEWKPSIDQCEKDMRNSDYEGLRDRVREGRSGEGGVDLSRVNLDDGGSAHGDGGGDWQGNQSQRPSHVAMCGTGFYFDSRGSVAITGRTEGIDESLYQEMREAGMKLGINSVDTSRAAFVMISHQYVLNKVRWARTPQWKRDLISADRRDKRASRDYEQTRDDSVHRKAGEIYKGFAAERVESDPYYEYGDPEEIERDEAIDMRSAEQLARSWRLGVDEEGFNACVVKYAAHVAGIKTDSIRARFKRNQKMKGIAEVVYVTDLHACGAVTSVGFDRDDLMAQYGDELIEMLTPRSDEERRAFIIEGSHDYFSKGNIWPAYVWTPEINEMLDSVVAVLAQAGVDMSVVESEIDWSRV